MGGGRVDEEHHGQRCGKLVKEHTSYRFGIPQTITTDQGTIFLAEEFKNFAKEMGITLLQSSPYYAQANGQAEVSNKSLIKLMA